MRFATKSRLAQLAGIVMVLLVAVPTTAWAAVLAHLLFDASNYGRLRHNH